MPWKNGQGTTSEIAIFPPIAQFPKDEFFWRLSSATVQSSNTFSQFPQYERLLIVWKGKGMVLNGQELLPGHPIQFSGEEKTECQLIEDQEVIDLGLIYRRDMVQAEMKVVTLNATHSQIIHLNQRIHFLFCAEGSFFADEVAVSAGETFQVQGYERFELKTSSTAKVFLVSVNLRS